MMRAAAHGFTLIEVMVALTIVAVVSAWPAAEDRLVRISAQQYNRLEDYERLAAAISCRG